MKESTRHCADVAERDISKDIYSHPKAYLLKIRGGVDVDSYGKKAGKGPLIQEEVSATLGTNQDQYLFQPIGVDIYTFSVTGEKSRCLSTSGGGLNEHIPVVIESALPILDDQDGGHVYTDVCGTLRAIPGDNRMAVAYGVTSKGNGDVFINPETHTSLTIGGGQAGQGYPCVMVCGSTVRAYDIGDRWRNPGEYIDKSPALTARCGTGGNIVPAVVYDARGNGGGETVNTITGDHENRITDYTSVVVYTKSRRAKFKGDFETWKESEVANTMNTFDTGDVRATTVVIEGNGARPSHSGDGYKESDVMYTLNTMRNKSGSYGGGSEVLVISPIPTESERCAQQTTNGFSNSK